MIVDFFDPPPYMPREVALELAKGAMIELRKAIDSVLMDGYKFKMDLPQTIEVTPYVFDKDELI